jgi:tetratricopeptide (TPR) repeat protein
MMQNIPAKVETYKPRWNQRNHRAFAQCFRFVFAVAVVLLLGCFAVAPSVLAQSSSSDWVDSAIAKGKKGDLDGAIADYSRAIEIDPKNTLAYNNRGNAKSNKGDQNGAIGDYNRAIEINPNYANAYNNRGSAFQAKGRFDQAVDDLNRAIELDTKDEYVYLRLLIATWSAKRDVSKATDRLRNHIAANNSEMGAYHFKVLPGYRQSKRAGDPGGGKERKR